MGRTGSSVYYYQYRGNSELGDYMGLFNVLNCSIGYAWATMTAATGFYYMESMWERIRKLRKSGGVSTMEGFKLLLSGFIIGLGGWASAMIVYNNGEKVMAFYHTYDTSLEANANGVNDYNNKGTALAYDLTYNTIMLWAGNFLSTTPLN